MRVKSAPGHGIDFICFRVDFKFSNSRLVHTSKFQTAPGALNFGMLACFMCEALDPLSEVVYLFSSCLRCIFDVIFACCRNTPVGRTTERRSFVAMTNHVDTRRYTSTKVAMLYSTVHVSSVHRVYTLNNVTRNSLPISYVIFGRVSIDAVT